MKIKELYAAIAQLNRQYQYYLNNPRELNTYILDFNKKQRVWEYYQMNERGGKHGLSTFSTEDEACEYVLNDAIQGARDYMNSWTDALRDNFLGEPLPNNHLLPMGKLYYAINRLNTDQERYLTDPSFRNIYASGYNSETKTWEYFLMLEKDGNTTIKTFQTEYEVSEYILNNAVDILTTFRDAWLKAHADGIQTP